jgi:hypothetical protein
VIYKIGYEQKGCQGSSKGIEKMWKFNFNSCLNENEGSVNFICTANNVIKVLHYVHHDCIGDLIRMEKTLNHNFCEDSDLKENFKYSWIGGCKGKPKIDCTRF